MRCLEGSPSPPHFCGLTTMATRLLQGRRNPVGNIEDKDDPHNELDWVPVASQAVAAPPSPLTAAGCPPPSCDLTLALRVSRASRLRAEVLQANPHVHGNASEQGYLDMRAPASPATGDGSVLQAMRYRYQCVQLLVTEQWAKLSDNEDVAKCSTCQAWMERSHGLVDSREPEEDWSMSSCGGYVCVDSAH